MAENKNNDEEGRVVYTGKEKQAEVKRSLTQIGKLNQTVSRMMSQIKAFPISRGQKQKEELNDFRHEIDQVIDRETDRIVSASAGANGKDIALFLNNLFAKNKSTQGSNNLNFRGLLQNKTLEELMNDPQGNFDLLLSDRYKNVNSLYEDIRLVTEQVSELSEVIDTFRDAIVNSDNMISDISRIVSFKNSSSGTEGNTTLIETVKNMEETTDIKNKLKKIIIPDTLRYGNFYVFTQPYTDLFAKFKAMDDKYQMMGHGSQYPNRMLRESYTPTDTDKKEIRMMYESFKPEFERVERSQGLSRHDKRRMTMESFDTLMENYINEAVNVIDDPEVPLMEDAEISALANPALRNSIATAINTKKSSKNWNPIGLKGNHPSGYADGVMDASKGMNEAEEKYKKEFGDINGCFIKLYDPKRCIPVFVMDFCIGYYVLYEINPSGETNILNSVHSISRTTMLFRDDKKREFESKFVGLIADRICRSIDKKFLSQNSDFRELIANAVAYDNFYQKAFRVQFVSSNYMTHFSINEDYNTHLGVSVLYRSMFYAMLYLLMLLYTILIKVTRGSDLRMFLIKGNGVNKDISGKMNKIISEFKQKQISYNDFGSVRGILSKVGSGKDIGVPVGANNERAFDIEQLPGVQVDMDTDLMQLLRKAMISTTGCPSAMVNYLEEVDFAKQIQMLHSKFMTRCITYQEETEKSCTELYRKLLRYGGYDITDRDIANLRFEWSRPKMLNNQNVNDLLSSSDQLAEFMIKIFEGENTVNDPRVKDRIYSHVVRNYLMPGVFDWDKIEDELKSFMLKLRSQIKQEDQSKIQGSEES